MILGFFRTAASGSFFESTLLIPAAEHKKNVDCCRHSENDI